MKSHEFRKYMHIERYGTDEVDGIELGKVYIFPKIDGTNGSVWYNEKGVSCGSRNRELTINDDNAGFCSHVMSNENMLKMCVKNKALIFYGEWLVPHTLKDYRDDTWRKFYVFDVFDRSLEKYVSYDEYSLLLNMHSIDYIQPLCITKNPQAERIAGLVDSNSFLMNAGCVGEGVVLKNYDYTNRFGRTTWAKIVRKEFKDKHRKAMPVGESMVEQLICDEFVTKSLCEKVKSKIENEEGFWSSKFIPRLLQTVYYDLITEDTWHFVKKHKNPVINFKRLSRLTTLTIKQHLPEVF